MNSLAGLLKAARGLEPADLVLKGGKVFNVFSGVFEETDLAIKDGIIVGLGRYDGQEEADMSGRWLIPGLIDTHMHIESTQLCPGELARVIVPRGTTAIVADPHEIANVLGLDGIRFMLSASEGLPLDVFLNVPSCVPATHMETAGAELAAEDLAELLNAPRVLGLAEVMNFPGVINGLPGVLDKLRLFAGRPIDGHAPFLSGRDLCAYVLPGIATDHECTNLEEAGEKLARGLRILIREGSTARNLEALLPLVSPGNLRRLAFCTDDRHPEDLIREGHLDHILRKALFLGLDPVSALTMATLNPAETFGLNDRGALAPGRIADVVVLESLDRMQVERVYKNGRLAAENGRLLGSMPPLEMPAWISPMNIGPLDEATLEVEAAGPLVRVIEVVEHQVLTGCLTVETPALDGLVVADPGRDLARIVVVERHKGTGNVGKGLVKGLGLKAGALASSVAHDSHNIVAAGMSTADLLAAVRAVEKMGGGQAVVLDGRVLAQLPLPIAGLMSDAPADQVAETGARLKDAARQTGAALTDPFMTLSFLALAVIPSLKITDMGLVDVEKFAIVPMFPE